MNNKKFEIALLIEMFSFMNCCWLVIFDEMCKVCLIANSAVNSTELYFNIDNALGHAMNYANDVI